MASVSVSTIVERATTLGEVSITAWNAIIEAEALGDAVGESKKAYVIAVVSSEVGEQLENISEALSDFIDSVVSFLNAFSWATKIVATMTTVLTILTYAPSLASKAVGLISKIADAVFEQQTGKKLDSETGEITESEEAEEAEAEDADETVSRETIEEESEETSAEESEAIEESDESE